MTGATLLAVAAMALATYATRISGFLLGRFLPQEGRLRRALDALPAAVLTALVAPAVTAGPAELAGGAVTLASARHLPAIVAIALGVATVAGLRSIL